MTAGSPDGTQCRSRSCTRRNLSWVSSPIVTCSLKRCGARGVTTAGRRVDAGDGSTCAARVAGTVNIVGTVTSSAAGNGGCETWDGDGGTDGPTEGFAAGSLRITAG